MNRQSTISYLICTKCSDIFPVGRQLSSQKSLYTRKKTYCITCKKETIHIETQDLDLLKSTLEFKDEKDMSDEEKEVYALVKRRRV